MASAAMIVLRRLPRNSSTTSAARSAPRTRCSFTASTLVRIVSELSRTTLQRVAGRQRRLDLAPGARAPRRPPRRCWRPTACGSTAPPPACRRCWRRSPPPPRRRRPVATSRTRIGWPSRCARRSRSIACTLLDAAADAQGQPLRAGLDRAARRGEVLRHERALHVDGGEPGRAQPDRVEPDVDLALPPADDRHLADAGDALERRRTSWSASSVISRIGRFDLQRQEQHRGRVRIELADDRALGPLGQIGHAPSRRARAPPARRRRCPSPARS